MEQGARGQEFATANIRSRDVRQQAARWRGDALVAWLVSRDTDRGHDSVEAAASVHDDTDVGAADELVEALDVAFDALEVL